MKTAILKLKQNWLTLIEVLMAILLFGSWIVVILSIIIQNISLAQRIQDKTTATMLAKEAIEMFYSYKDTNIDKGEYWDSHDWGFLSPNTEYCIQRLTNWKIEVTKNCAESQQRLIEYVNTWAINNDWMIFKYWSPQAPNRLLSRFRRYCQFKEIGWANISPPNLMRDAWQWHLALVITCTVESASQSITSRKTSVTLSSMIWQNRE